MGARHASASLRTVAIEWTRLGLTGFGGPPAHHCFASCAGCRSQEMDGQQGVRGRERGVRAVAGAGVDPAGDLQRLPRCWGSGALVGGLGFVVPAVLAVIALSVVFLSGSPPVWVVGAGAGAGAAVPAVALRAGIDLVKPSFNHAQEHHGHIVRWGLYVVAGALAAILAGQFLVLVLVACGSAELAGRTVLRGTCRSTLCCCSLRQR